MAIRAYLRASTNEQDASRAMEEMTDFCLYHRIQIDSTYAENASGTTVERPELKRMLKDCNKGDIILIEKMDRLARLPHEQWLKLKNEIQSLGVSIVLLDQPMTHAALTPNKAVNGITQAITNFMIDLAAGMARDDYETRKKRTRQGIEKARAEGRYKGRPQETDLHNKIAEMLENGKSWGDIRKDIVRPNNQKVSRSTIAKVAKQLKENKELVSGSIENETIPNWLDVLTDLHNEHKPESTKASVTKAAKALAAAIGEADLNIDDEYLAFMSKPARDYDLKRKDDAALYINDLGGIVQIATKRFNKA